MTFPLKPLLELGAIQTGSTPLTSDPNYWIGDVPFVTPSELDAASPVIQAPRTLSETGVLQSRLLNADAVMVCCIGSLGKIGIAGRTVVTNQQINSIEFDSQKIWPKYGFYACQRLKPMLIAMAPATTIPIVSKSKFGQLQIPVPTLPEQRRIAAILDQADALRAKRREALAQLDSLTQSIFIEMFGDPASNTLNLPWASLGELGTWHSGGTPPRSKSAYFDGSIPWFSSGELEAMYVWETDEHISELAIKETAAKRVPSGALMLGMYDTAALKASISAVDCSCNQAIAFANIRPDVADTVYVYYAIVIGREHFRRLQRGVRQKNLNLSMIRDIRIPTPSTASQRAFACNVKAIEALKASHRAALQALDKLFASLQHRAFAGEL